MTLHCPSLGTQGGNSRITVGAAPRKDLLVPELNMRSPEENGSVGAFLFDVDGVIADTAGLHTGAWRRLAEEEGLLFDDEAADTLRGLPRPDSLRRLLGKRSVPDACFSEMMERKNRYYLASVENLSDQDVLPGVQSLLHDLSQRGVRLAAVSLSRNARLVLIRVGISRLFDFVFDGNEQRGAASGMNRYQQAANTLQIPPNRCVVIEDAAAGIAAACVAEMRSVGIGCRERLREATFVLESLRGVDAGVLLKRLDRRRPRGGRREDQSRDRKGVGSRPCSKDLT